MPEVILKKTIFDDAPTAPPPSYRRSPYYARIVVVNVPRYILLRWVVMTDISDFDYMGPEGENSACDKWSIGHD